MLQFKRKSVRYTIKKEFPKHQSLNFEENPVGISKGCRQRVCDRYSTPSPFKYRWVPNIGCKFIFILRLRPVIFVFLKRQQGLRIQVYSAVNAIVFKYYLNTKW